MLKHIPFYASLLGRPLPAKAKAQRSHVLVYGAIEKHDDGPKGCIASNKTIAAETGYGVQTVANTISELAAAKWVEVVLGADNQRKSIRPLMTLTLESNPPYSGGEPPLTAEGNIESIKGNSKVEPSAPGSVLVDEPGQGDEPPKAPAPPSTLALYCQVNKKYGLPVDNFNHIRAKSKAFDAEIGEHEAQTYLQILLDIDYQATNGDFKPTLEHSRDVYSKRIKICKFLKDNAAHLSRPNDDKMAAFYKKRDEDIAASRKRLGVTDAPK